MYEVIGEYVRGLGEGRKYVSMPYYREEMRRITGEYPYPGTFNVRVEEEERQALLRIAESHGHRIEPRGELGGAWLYPCTANGVRAWLVFPDLAEHRDHLELISGLELRRALGVLPGDPVKIRLWGPRSWRIWRSGCARSGGR